MGKLKSEKQERFCLEYIVDLNATQAAIRAGYAERSARSQGSKLLTKGDIQARVGELNGRRQERTKIDADWVLQRLALIADVRFEDLYNESGKLLLPAELGEGAQYLVSGVKVREEFVDGEAVGETVEVKLESRLKALELIGKHVRVGAWEENVNLTQGGDRAERIRRYQKRMGIRGTPEPGDEEV